MAQFTIELYMLLDLGYDIGLSNYPIFKEEHREELNKRIQDHYYFREIGQETPDRFKFMMERTMNEIMPKYNPLYEALEKKYDWLSTMNIEEVMDGDKSVKETNKTKETVDSSTSESRQSKDKAKGSSNTVGTSDEVTSGGDTTLNSSKPYTDVTKEDFLDTPESGKAIGDGYLTTQKITEEENDARTSSETTMRDTTVSNNDKSATTSNTEAVQDASAQSTGKGLTDTNEDKDLKEENDYVKTMKGYSGKTPAEMFKEYVKNVMNIDLMIINELEPLFLNLY